MSNKQKRDRQKSNRRKRYATHGCFKAAQRARRILRGRAAGDLKLADRAIRDIPYVLEEKNDHGRP